MLQLSEAGHGHLHVVGVAIRVTVSPQSCRHEEVTQLEFLHLEYPLLHGPKSEIWQVRCDGCGKVFEDSFIGD